MGHGLGACAGRTGEGPGPGDRLARPRTRKRPKTGDDVEQDAADERDWRAMINRSRHQLRPRCRLALGGLGFLFGRGGKRARVTAQRNASPPMTRSSTTSVDDVCELEPKCELSNATTISVPIVTVVRRPPARNARRILSGLVVW